jgi:hypothetical protein
MASLSSSITSSEDSSPELLQKTIDGLNRLLTEKDALIDKLKSTSSYGERGVNIGGDDRLMREKINNWCRRAGVTVAASTGGEGQTSDSNASNGGDTDGIRMQTVPSENDSSIFTSSNNDDDSPTVVSNVHRSGDAQSLRGGIYSIPDPSGPDATEDIPLGDDSDNGRLDTERERELSARELYFIILQDIVALRSELISDLDAPDADGSQ